jgi:hypothetical protein
MKIVSFYEFKSRPEALQAAGLSEQDAQGPVNRA